MVGLYGKIRGSQSILKSPTGDQMLGWLYKNNNKVNRKIFVHRSKIILQKPSLKSKKILQYLSVEKNLMLLMFGTMMILNHH